MVKNLLLHSMFTTFTVVLKTKKLKKKTIYLKFLNKKFQYFFSSFICYCFILSSTNFLNAS